MMADLPTPSWPDELRNAAAVRKLAERYWTEITHSEAQAEREFERVFPAARLAGELEKSLFVKVAIWKSPRPQQRYLANPEEDVRGATRKAFQAPTRALAIGSLCALEGVALRTATALLHWMRPEEFPILDVRMLEAIGWPEPANFEDAEFYDAFTLAVIEQSQSVDASLRVFDRAGWTWSEVNGMGRLRRGTPRATPPSPPALRAAGSNSEAAETIDCWITNIASHADRARSGDRFELCVHKAHSPLFPAHDQVVYIAVNGRRWRGTIGNRAGVAHLYFHTGLVDEKTRESTVTKVLRSAGFAVGDRPKLRNIGRHAFSLEH